MAETCIPGQGVTTDTCLHIISLLLPVSKEVYLQNFERHSREVYSIFEHAFCLMIFQDSDTIFADVSVWSDLSSILHYQTVAKAVKV